MNRIRIVLHTLSWLGLVALVLLLWGRENPLADRGPSRDGWTVLKDLPYRTTPPEVRLDLYLPGAGDRSRSSLSPVPVVIAIHGGSWAGGSRAEYGPQVARFVRHGYAVVVPDYRLSRPESPGFPEALDDLREAVRWVRTHASKYGLDANRVAALGSGAGANLAALLGTDPPAENPGVVSARVQAVVDLYGPTDLTALLASRRLENEPITRFVGRSDPRALSAASPLEHVSAGDAPMLIIHGLDDRWVPPDQSRALGERLASTGVRHQIVLVPGARHGFELTLEAPVHRDLVPEILAFLQSVWQAGVRDEP